MTYLLINDCPLIFLIFLCFVRSFRSGHCCRDARPRERGGPRRDREGAPGARRDLLLVPVAVQLASVGRLDRLLRRAIRLLRTGDCDGADCQGVGLQQDPGLAGTGGRAVRLRHWMGT